MSDVNSYGMKQAGGLCMSLELTIENLSKTYPNGVQALKDVTLKIPTGMFGLLGPNGAGKSTLMRTIATLQEPDQGSIRFNGMDVLKDKDSVRRVLGYLPQEFGVYPKVSPEVMLNHFAVLKGITDIQTTERNRRCFASSDKFVGCTKRKARQFFRRNETTVRNCASSTWKSKIDYCR